jgi:Restriction endonuclease
MKAGEQLQQLVQTLERLTASTENLKIESPKRLVDKDTGRLREHDVVLTFSMGHHELIVALECRDRSRKVGVPEVESFKKKCDRTGVHRGVIVSSTGFTQTALKKSMMMDIECLQLDEIERFDWCEAPGVQSRTTEITEGPNFKIFPATPVSTEPALYDREGRLLDNQRLRAIAFDCLRKRPQGIADQQDEAAIHAPVGIRFIDPDGNYQVDVAKSALYLKSA